MIDLSALLAVLFLLLYSEERLSDPNPDVSSCNGGGGITGLAEAISAMLGDDLIGVELPILGVFV